MEALNEDQRTRITWMMIAAHLRCETCGSVQLTCGDTAWKMLGNYMVEVFCNDPEHPDDAPRQQPRFKFPLEDGPRVGLR